MRGRNSKEDEDSGSDWDSMSEMEPAPKIEKKQALSHSMFFFSHIYHLQTCILFLFMVFSL